MPSKRGDSQAGAPHEVTLEDASYTYPGGRVGPGPP